MFIDENPVFEILEVLKEKREKRCFKTKKRNVNVISCRTEGRAEFYCNEINIPVKSGDVLYIPEQIEYSQETNGETIIAIHLKIYSGTTAGLEHINVKNTEHTILCFEEIYSEWIKKLPGYRQRCASMLYGLLGDIKAEQSYSKNNAYSKIVNSVIYMKSHFNKQDICISDIAAQSNISEIYFRKLWQRYFKLTPAQYISQLRINYAKALLIGSDYTISEIAENSGFSDVKYFSTKFRLLTGTTPSEYRKKSSS